MHPDHADARYNTGLMLLKQGNADSALHYFHETIQVEPEHVLVNNTIGVILAQQGQYEKAVDYFSHALKGNPEYKNAQINREKALRKLHSRD